MVQEVCGLDVRVTLGSSGFGSFGSRKSPGGPSGQIKHGPPQKNMHGRPQPDRHGGPGGPGLMVTTGRPELPPGGGPGGLVVYG